MILGIIHTDIGIEDGIHLGIIRGMILGITADGDGTDGIALGIIQAGDGDTTIITGIADIMAEDIMVDGTEVADTIIPMIVTTHTEEVPVVHLGRPQGKGTAEEIFPAHQDALPVQPLPPAIGLQPQEMVSDLLQEVKAVLGKTWLVEAEADLRVQTQPFQEPAVDLPERKLLPAVVREQPEEAVV